MFGRSRPAVGFSLDLKALAAGAAAETPPGAVRAPWSEDPGLRAAVRRLREAGETVISVLPGDAEANAAPGFDRELVVQGGAWQLRALPQTGTN